MAGHILLKIPENVEPPGSGEDVLIAADLEVVVCGHGVVDPPQPAGHKVGKKNINTIVTPRRHQGADAHQTDQEGNPMKKNIPPWRILFNGEIPHGEGHGVPGEDVVPAVDVLSIDGEASAR